MRAAHIFLPHSFHHTRAHVLRHYSYFSYALLFLFIGLFFTVLHKQNPSILGFASNVTVNDVIVYTNQERQKIGAPTLKVSPELSKAAEEKAHDMFQKNYWAHFGPNGEKPWDFIKRNGYVYSAAGENLARDFQDSSAVVTAWMNSPSHKENLLNKSYQDIGIAVINGTLLGHETTLVVQMFGKPFRSKVLLLDSDEDTVAQVPASSTAPQLKTSVPSTPTLAPSPYVTLAPSQLPQSVTTAGVTSPPKPPAAQTPAFLAGVNSFTITKALAIFMVMFIITFLLLDTIIIRKRGVYRIATHSFAHVSVLAIVAITILLLESGKIL